MRTIDIPGGTAQLRDRPEELRVRQHRIVDNATVSALPAFRKINEARRTLERDGIECTNSELTREAALSRKESEALMERQDAQIVALLASWTLDRVLPN